MNNADVLKKAEEVVEKRHKEEFIKEFENGSRGKTDLLRVNTDEGADFYYGVAALKDGKLVGFDIMTYSKMYMDGKGYSMPEEPYTDKTGKQVRLTVDEYFKFQEDIKAGDTRLGVLLEKGAKMAEIQNEAARLKAADKIDTQQKVAEGLALLNRKRER